MHAVFAQNGNEKDGKIREPTTLKEHINARANYSRLYFRATFAWANFASWNIDFYPRLDKCHRRSQIFPISFADFDSSEVLVSFSAFIFS